MNRKTQILQKAAVYFDKISALHIQFKKDLEKLGIQVGALIRRDYDGSIYKITRINDITSKYGCSLMGLKLRKDGSYGAHEHSIDNADCVTPVNDSKGDAP